MSIFKYVFTPSYDKYEGVRPINIYLLRLFYFLMAAFVATDAWQELLTHQGPWDRFRAMSFCVWAAYTTLGVLGLLHPLKWLPRKRWPTFFRRTLSRRDRALEIFFPNLRPGKQRALDPLVQE